MEAAIVHGPAGQGEWLRTLGIGARAAALKAKAPERAAEVDAACDRLTGAEQMGVLFKALAVTAPGWPEPAGF